VQCETNSLSQLTTGVSKQLAVADATCEQQLNYAPQRRNIEDRYLTAMARRFAGEITSVKQINETAMANAAKVLAGA
jgi:hypothetical protein